MICLLYTSREIADKIGAILMIDMAHPAGLIAAGELDNPVKYAHIVTSTCLLYTSRFVTEHFHHVFGPDRQCHGSTLSVKHRIEVDVAVLTAHQMCIRDSPYPS